MLWGRLDGAERLIKMLAPGNDNNVKLIRDAQNAILKEDLRPRDQRTIFQWVNQLARGEENQEPASDAKQAADQKRPQTWSAKLSALPADLKAALIKRIQALDRSRYQAVLRVFAEDQDLLDLFKSGYEINREFPRRQTVNLIARTLQVAGNMFEGLTTKYPILSGPVGLLIFAGRLFFGLAQMSTENILGWLFLNLILALYVMLALIAAGGVFLHDEALANLGWIGLALVLFVNVSILFLASWMQKRIRILRTFEWLAHLLAWILALGALVLLILGLAYARSLGSVPEIGHALYAFFSSFLLK